LSQPSMLKKFGSPDLGTWLEWALLLIGLGMISIPEAFQLYTIPGLACLLGAFVLRVAHDGGRLYHTRMEIPGLVFLASAALATWISYDQEMAFLQFERLVAGGVLFYAVAGRKISARESSSAHRKELELRLIGVGILALASGLAIYWPLHQDYSALDNKFFLVTNLLAWIQAHMPAIPGPTINHDVAAGTLILATPLGFGLVMDARRRGAAIEALLEAVAIVILLIGLLLTISRGAWMGLAAAVGLAFLVVIQRRWLFAPARRVAFWVVVVLGGLAIIEVLILSGRVDRLVGQIPDPGGALQSRTTVWSEGLDLIGDYVYTGSGLMSVPRVFAIYELLIWVPFQSNLHNLYLEVWLEQGILGEIALLSILGIVAGWAWKALSVVQKPYSSTQSILGWAGLVGVLAITVHGLVDVVFYGQRTVPLVGLILGFAYLAHSPSEATISERSGHHHRNTRIGIAVAVLCLVLLGLFYRPLVSAFYANLGAIEQTRLELSIYNPDNFQNDTLDQVRQRLSLGSAQDALRKSLDWNPENRVALLRLGEIALSRRDASSAQATLQAAWDNGYRDSRTRLLYGDLLVMQGQVQRAASVQQGVAWAVERMAGQAWYRYWVNKDYRRARDAWQTVLLLDPSNKDAGYWVEQAVQQLKAGNP
jgi:O-antigen ligase/cytochrome c-type biogenesis protein CcmH/NrfG